MTKRGKVLRDTNSGPGLLSVDGVHYSFSLESDWKSDLPPAIGMSVSVELSADGDLIAVRAVPESQIAREQAELVLANAREKGSALASEAVSRFGVPTLVAAGFLIIGWFFLSSISFTTPLGKLDFTFWQLLGFLNSTSPMEAVMQGSRGGTSSGLYGFLAVAALAGPFLSYFWKDKRASLAGLVPLLFMLLVGLLIRNALHSMVGADGAGGMFREMMQQASEELRKAISIGVGVYLSFLASLYFAAVAIKKFLVQSA